jgi:hypothetical protein
VWVALNAAENLAMPDQDLTKIVDELTEHLDGVEDLDAGSREALQEAASRIRDALASEEPTGSLLDGLRERLERFESNHPTITETVRRLVDQLSDMGI